MPESLENQSQIDPTSSNEDGAIGGQINRKPRETDAVLGGQAPRPFTAAVLGGMAGFKRYFASRTPEEIIVGLRQARSYGKDGLELAVQSLKNKSWQVQYAACKFLHENAPELQKALQVDNPCSERSFAQFSAPSIRSYSYSYNSSIEGLTLSPNKQFVAIGLQARGHCPFVDHIGYATAAHLLHLPSSRMVKLQELESDDRSSGEGRFVAFAFSADSQTLASFQDFYPYPYIELWSVPNGQLITRFDSRKYRPRSLAISPDGQTLAIGTREKSSEKNIELRDSSAGTLLATLIGHSDVVYSLAFSPDGRTLVSGSQDKTIKLWDLPSGKLRASLTGHASAVTAVAVSPDGEAIASSSWDKTIKLWDLASGELIHAVTECSEKIASITFLPEGLFLSRSDVGEIRLLDNICNSRLDPMELFHRYIAFKEALNTSPENLDMVIEALKDNSPQVQHLAECFLVSRLAEPRVRKAMAEYKPSYK